MAADGHHLRVLMVMEAAYPALKGGGAEAQVRTLARGLRRRGHRVTILVPCLPWAPTAKVDRYDGSVVCRDRQSTRLNSSHVKISYAVFCLKKKTNGKSNDKQDDIARCEGYDAKWK